MYMEIKLFSSCKIVPVVVEMVRAHASLVTGGYYNGSRNYYVISPKSG